MTAFTAQGPTVQDILGDLPPSALHHVRIRARHGEEDPEAALQRALGEHAGRCRVVHHALIRRSLTWEKSNWKLSATTNRRGLTLRAPRLRPSQLQAVLTGLAGMEGFRDVQVEGRPGPRR